MNVNHVKRCLLRIQEYDSLLTLWQWGDFIHNGGKENVSETKRMTIRFKTQGLVNHDRLLCRTQRGEK